jgi:hypothetical protein
MGTGASDQQGYQGYQGDLRDLGFTMPPGLTGSLKGISYCPEANIASASQKLGRTEQAIPSCPASSTVGTTNVAAGPGTHPFHAVGRMYVRPCTPG